LENFRGSRAGRELGETVLVLRFERPVVVMCWFPEQPPGSRTPRSDGAVVWVLLLPVATVEQRDRFAAYHRLSTDPGADLNFLFN